MTDSLKLRHLASVLKFDGYIGAPGVLVDIADRLDAMEGALSDWLDCADTPEEWMRCRHAAKAALGRIGK